MTIGQPAAVPAAEVNLTAVFEQTWAEIEAEEAKIIADPKQWRRRDRLEELRRMVVHRMDDLDATTAQWLNDEYASIYGYGAQAATTGDFTWTQTHLDALSQLSEEFFEDVLQRTRHVKKDAKRFVRDVARGRIQQMLAQGRTPAVTARDVERVLRERGIKAITYRDGSRHGLAEYTKMLTRTKSAQAYNRGTLVAAASEGVQYFEIIDGPECGLSFHLDPTLAAGMIVDRDTADKYYIAHPNCRRSFAPRPDVRSKAEAKKADPFNTEQQREDIRRADETRRRRALRSQQRAKERGAAKAKKAAEARAQKEAARAKRAAERAERARLRAEQAAAKQAKPEPALPRHGEVKPADLTNKADIESMSKTGSVLTDHLNAEAERFGIKHGGPDDVGARALLKQKVQQERAADLMGRLDEFPELRATLNRDLVHSMSPDDIRVLRRDTMIQRNRSTVGVTSQTQHVDASGYLTPDGDAALARAGLGGRVRSGANVLDLNDAELAALGYPGDLEALLEKKMGAITRGWAMTSGDSSPSAVAFQVLAAERFGYSTDSMWRGLDALHDSERYAGTAAGFRDEVQQILLGSNREYMTAYLDSTYRATQTALAEAGITEVVLERGIKFGPSWGVPAPSAIVDQFHGVPKEPLSRGYTRAQTMRAVGNPMQSWTTNSAIAEAFRGNAANPTDPNYAMIFAARVPAERVLSFPATGPGCLNEYEWVLLGLDDVAISAKRAVL